MRSRRSPGAISRDSLRTSTHQGFDHPEQYSDSERLCPTDPLAIGELIDVFLDDLAAKYRAGAA